VAWITDEDRPKVRQFAARPRQLSQCRLGAGSATRDAGHGAVPQR
jgi:hypothetical protein